jgi:hypothetical protein
LIERLENVATPEAPETGALPVSVAPGVPVPGVIATATFPAKPAVLANWSRMVTTTLEMLVTAVALPGCVVIESAVAAAATVLNPALVPAVKPPPEADNVYPPLFVMVRPEKLATPATAATVFVPRMVPPVGPVPTDSVTMSVKQLWTAPELSCALTVTENGTPAVRALGCAVNTSVPTHGPPLSEWHVATNSVSATAALARTNRVANGARKARRETDNVVRIPLPRTLA